MLNCNIRTKDQVFVALQMPICLGLNYLINIKKGCDKFDSIIKKYS